MRDIPLGSINSKLYEKDGRIFYKISPIIGLQTNVWGDFDLSKVRVLRNDDQCLSFKQGSSKIEMRFKKHSPGLEKVRVVKYLFGIVPLGAQFCEISEVNKTILRDQFKPS